MGVASPLFTRTIEPAVAALVLRTQRPPRPVTGMAAAPAAPAPAARGVGAAMTGLDLRPLIPAAASWPLTGLVVLLARPSRRAGSSAPSAPLSLAGLGGALAAVGILGLAGRGAAPSSAGTRGRRRLRAVLPGPDPGHRGCWPSCFSPSYLRATGIDRGEYYALLLFSVVGMLGLVSCLELVSLFVALEIMSVAVYAMAGLHRDRAESRRPP